MFVEFTKSINKKKIGQDKYKYTVKNRDIETWIINCM